MLILLIVLSCDQSHAYPVIWVKLIISGAADAKPPPEPPYAAALNLTKTDAG